MSDLYFRQVLGVTENASREQIRQAYRRLVMINHPDRFSAEKKPLQELAMITLTEAYSALMSTPPEQKTPAGARTGSSRAKSSGAVSPCAEPTDPRSREAALAPHKDPAYAYYKQGFINFSLAIHGIAEINRTIAAGRVPRFTRRYTAAEDIAGSLGFLRAAHGYFTRVATEHTGSVWSADSRQKLRRIEQFTAIYRRILENLGGKPPG
ncbi:MAG: J domain-containing protein [Spirochaetia bacterium]|jgi:curved DNA-binding protein CbpA